MSKFQLTKEEVGQNIHNLSNFLRKEKVDALYISSFDIYLNEYVPLQDCLRYYLTGFSGSVAEVLLYSDDTLDIFVDGRYYEQVDKEIKHSQIKIYKTPQTHSNKKYLQDVFKEKGLEKLGIVKERTPLRFAQDLQEDYGLIEFATSKIEAIFKHKTPAKKGKIENLDKTFFEKNTSDKLKLIVPEGQGIFINALDAISWLTNLRGHQLPFQATFMAKAFATNDVCYLFVDAKNAAEINNLNRTELKALPIEKIAEGLAFILENHKLSKVQAEASSISYADFISLKECFQSKTDFEFKGLTKYHASKDEREIEAFRASFERSDRAIYNCLKWLKKNYTNSSELDFFNKANELYRQEGAIAQSFNTIAGFGENSSVIHFSDSSKDKYIAEGELALLDSGAFYKEGLATDTTRTVVCGKAINPEACKIYTIVLKGLLNIQNAVFDEATTGAQLDAICRGPIQAAGYDFMHGIGHGIGINVHEGGFGISTKSQAPLTVGTVGSLEPGIYIEGFGGVRLENVSIVKKASEKGKLRFENLVYIGFDHDLIDLGLLNEQEKKWLDEYEAECTKRNTSFL